jgi:hypothetical protein
MSKHHSIFLIPVMIMCTMLLSCQSAKTPLQISEHFWFGIKTKNSALVKKYSLASSMNESEDIEQFENLSDFTFGKIIIDGDKAEVETNVKIISNENTKDARINTYLENNNDVWKVNYKKTIRQLKDRQNVAEIFDDIEEMTEEITKELEESVEEMKEKIVPEIKEKVVPKIKSEIENAEKELLEKLPELKDMFDEFLHELEKSLEDLLPPEEESKTQET